MGSILRPFLDLSLVQFLRNPGFVHPKKLFIIKNQYKNKLLYIQMSNNYEIIQPRDLEYEKNNIIYQYNNGSENGIKCMNYLICNEGLPDWWWDCKNNYLCTNCDMLFGPFNNGKGILEIKMAECPICLEEKKCVTQPRCHHCVCIKCFKRCYYGNPINETFEDNESFLKLCPLCRK
jgi:hypothetical protein